MAPGKYCLQFKVATGILNGYQVFFDETNKQRHASKHPELNDPQFLQIVESVLQSPDHSYPSYQFDLKTKQSIIQKDRFIFYKQYNGPLYSGSMPNGVSPVQYHVKVVVHKVKHFHKPFMKNVYITTAFIVDTIKEQGRCKEITTI